MALAEDPAEADSAVDTDPVDLAHIITDTITITDRIFITTYTSHSLASIAVPIITMAVDFLAASSV